MAEKQDVLYAPGSLEKGSQENVEHATNPAVDYPNKGSDIERKMLRRIDLRLVPALGFMYACSLIDRTNLPNARLSGMDRALGTNIGIRYTLCVTFFFIPYILVEIPANSLFKKSGIRPRLWLPTATLLFGLIMVCHAFSPNWQTLAGLRWPLGAFEGVLFPGSILLISSWYPRYEVQKRISAFYLMGASVSGFGNIIAYGFSLMAGLQGRPGYEWIFIMMGVLTIISAVVGYIMVPNFPGQASFLTPVEKQLVHDRITADRHDFEDERLTLGAVFKNLGNLRIWANGLLFCLSTLPAYAFSYFLALILRQFGYSVRDSQLLSAPPYIASVIIGLVVAYFADRTRVRGPFVIAGALCSMTGSCVLAFTRPAGIRYFGAFLAIIGCQSNIPTIMAWSQNNIRGSTARAVNSAVVVAGGGIGGIVASVAFRSQDAATGYRPGLWTTISSQIVIVIIVLALTVYYKSQNRQAQTQGKVLQNQPGFLYTL